ncbi:MAG: Hsp20/alpha crystallin family protein [Bacteroides sp.]|nr:Hsp20/alpha crystallin family protein [Bacteroides sp.]
MNNSIKKYRRDFGFPTFFNRFWDNDFFSNSEEMDLPAVNVKENKNEFKLEISVPGYDKEDIKIDINKNIMTISAKKEMNKEEKGEDDKVLRQDFRVSSFYRSFTLPENIDTEKIEAQEKSGILNIMLPKMEKALEDTRKKIEVK